MPNTEVNDQFYGMPKEKKHFGNPGGYVRKRGSKGDVAMPERTAAWPGLPGKKQPRSRDAGVRKLKIHAKSEGL